MTDTTRLGDYDAYVAYVKSLLPEKSRMGAIACFFTGRHRWGRWLPKYDEREHGEPAAACERCGAIWNPHMLY